MSNREYYLAKLDAIKAIPDDQIKKPNMPIDIFVQEAEYLYHWCLDDQAALTGAGLDWALVTDLPVRAGACREAQSLWFKERFTRQKAKQDWKEKSSAAYELRDRLLRTMRYAYRKQPDLLNRVAEIAEDTGHADMIQDLNDLAVLGRDHSEPLKLIKFDLTLLDTAAAMAIEMGKLLAQTTTDRDDTTPSLVIRDQAFTYLKQAMDEIRECGQYVFWQNPARLKGYSSDYFRKRRNAKKSSSAEPDMTVATKTPE